MMDGEEKKETRKDGVITNKPKRKAKQVNSKNNKNNKQKKNSNICTCKIIDCKNNHTKRDPALFCENKKDCMNYDCDKYHSKARVKICKYGELCTRDNCCLLHPNQKKLNCQNADLCIKLDCNFSHPENWNPNPCEEPEDCKIYDCKLAHFYVRKGPCSRGNCNNGECEYLHKTERIYCENFENCDIIECLKLHSKKRIGPCDSLNDCYNAECKFLHLKIIERCEFLDTCSDYECKKAHNKVRGRNCLSGELCWKYDCKFVHPIERGEPCKNSKKCRNIECKLKHPNWRPEICLQVDSCIDISCRLLHASSRVLCPKQKKCKSYNCKKIHPSSRIKCPNNMSCFDRKCELLHKKKRIFCSNKKCTNYYCTKIHPLSRPEKCKNIDCSNDDCEYLHPDDSKIENKKSEKKLKTLEERNAYQLSQNLPILQCKEDFILKLKKEKILVVTAETGSGKTTQLPQYVAEYFDGKIYCTQPRAIAAISIAQRISNEFDGTDVGNNVGYTVGGKTKKGKKIMMMTDASLVREAQKSKKLQEVSVLIIDEAHERSLNTDVVLGIAKTILQERDDFYCVISSATIDPYPFLNFFNDSENCEDTLDISEKLLNVKGRTFPVETNNICSTDDVDYLSVNHLDIVRNVKRQLKEHDSGHCLVFLPGSKDIEKCIKLFNNSCPNSCVSFPLYGSLPPEEQQKIFTFKEENKRMVIFCTNIAETSLTINNVQLVIDTGLAKEASYDPERRMTIINMTFISRSSAEQRKGRAGRTSPGFCCRLYPEECITREHIQPEILRSSLDRVLLELCRLGYSPNDFPLISRPPQNSIESSMETLISLECITENNKITSLGKIYVDMPFDPRLSHFVTNCFKYGKLELGSTIAAILTAPGSMFFIGSGNERDNRKQKHSTIASNHDSDILCLYNTYHKWFAKGIKKQEKCTSCNKKLKRIDCLSCKASYAKKNHLNNKVLQYIQTTTKQVDKIFKDIDLPKFKDFTEINPCEELEIVGKSLVVSFQEQIAEMLCEDNPSAGVYLPETALKGIINSTSAISQRINNKVKLMISMSLIQNSTGSLYLDKIHPLKEEWLPTQIQKKLDMKKSNTIICGSFRNVNKRFVFLLTKYFNNLTKDLPLNDPKKLIVCNYDDILFKINIYAPEQISYFVYEEANSFIEKNIEKELKYSVSFNNNTIKMKSGMEIINISPENTRIQHKGKKEKQFQKNETCKKLKLVLDNNPDLDSYLNNNCINITYNNISKVEVEYLVKYSNIPSSLSDDDLKKIAGSKDIRITLKNNLKYGRIWYTSKEDAQNGINALKENSECQNGILEYNGRTKTVSVNANEENSKHTYFLNFNNTNDTKEFYTQVVNKTNTCEDYNGGISGEITCVILHPQLFNMNQLLKQVAQHCDIKISKPIILKNKKEKQQKRYPKALVKLYGNPSYCNKAYKILSNCTKPLKPKFTLRKAQLLIIELRKKNWFTEKKEQLNLFIEFSINSNKKLDLIIYGEEKNQGMLMAGILEQYDIYENRYKAIVAGSNGFIFTNNRVGVSKLLTLNSKYPASIQYFKFDNIIEIIVDESCDNPTDIINQVTIEVNEIFNSYGDSSISFETSCIFCKLPCSHCFSICGHYYCKSCLLSKLEKTDIIQCNCKREVSLKDLRDTFTIDQLDDAAINRAMKYIKENKNSPVVFCPFKDCKSLLSKDKSYYMQCNNCENSFCWSCNAENDDSHLDRSCKEYQNIVKNITTFDVKKLFQEAKQFVKNNWKPGLGNIKDIKYDLNPGLEMFCPAMERYWKGRLSLGAELSKDKFFFAWHGTDESAIAPICDQGFDPNRRSGQACGPGEYFGQSADTSNGYARACGKLIVAQLIQVPETSKHGSFCYVVNNPKDWKLAYNLPVMVIHFGNTKRPIPYIKRTTLPDGAFSSGITKSLNITENVTVTKCPWTWYWQENDSNFIEYTDTTCLEIEGAYQIYLKNNSISRYTLRPVLRYLDDLPTEYIIDFSTFTQELKFNKLNLRKLQRERTPTFEYDNNMEWVFQNQTGMWQLFQQKIQLKLERNYRNYCDGNPNSSSILQFITPGRPEKYDIDFIKFTQTNLSTNTTRIIKRRPISNETLGKRIELTFSLNSEIIPDNFLSTLDDKVVNLIARAFNNTEFEIPESNIINNVLTYSITKEVCLISDIIKSFVREYLYKTCNIRSELSNVESRLELLLSSESPKLDLKNRSNSILFLAHAIIWKAKCCIYGGFIRDWIIRNEEANDIDVHVYSIENTSQVLKNYAKKYGFNYKGEKMKGKATCLEFSGEWSGRDIEIDLVENTIKRLNPGVDCDVGSFEIDGDGIKTVKNCPISLPIAISNCKKKQFVFYYDFNDINETEMVKRRFKKYITRGWSCISVLPEEIKNEFADYSTQFNPQPQYNLNSYT